MSEQIDSIFAELTGDVPRGTARMQVLINPTAAQIRAIPLGSDIAYTSPRQFQSGIWDEEVRDLFAECAGQNDCGHMHGFLIYTPPVPTDDSALTAEAIAKHAADMFEESVRKATSDTPDPEWPLHDVLELMVEAAVHKARDGMVFPPF